MYKYSVHVHVYVIIFVQANVHVHVHCVVVYMYTCIGCAVTLLCYLFDLACFFLSSFSISH